MTRRAATLAAASFAAYGECSLLRIEFLTNTVRYAAAIIRRNKAGIASSVCGDNSVSMSLYDLDPGPDTPNCVRMIVEIPKNSTNKYEYDSELGLFRLDRTLYSPMHYPGDYGFIPGTLAEDRDPLDVLALVEEPSYPGIAIVVRPVGVLLMVDQQEPDAKILAVPDRNPRFEQIHKIEDVFPHSLREIEHFFTIYKELEGKRTEMRGWRGPDEARQLIHAARKRYIEK
jgi:inorganic pyrophosphatase